MKNNYKTNEWTEKKNKIDGKTITAVTLVTEGLVALPYEKSII